MTEKNPANWGDFNSAVRLREVIHAMAKEAIEKNRPKQKYGTVQSVDRFAMQAQVVLETDTDSITIPMPAANAPFSAGDVVLVDTTLGALKVNRVIYSPSYPGGTYDHPALVEPTEIDTNGQVLNQRRIISFYYENILVPIFLGRWYQTNPAGTNRFIVIRARASQWSGYSGANTYTTMSCIFTTQGLHPNAWRTVPFDSFSDYQPSYLLEYRYGNENNQQYFELRGRANISTGIVYPIKWELDITGPVSQDEINYPPFADVTAPRTTVAPELSDNPGDSGVLDLSSWNTTGSGSPAHSIPSGTFRIKNGIVTAAFQMKVGQAISTPANGNIVNTVFGYVPSYLIPPMNVPLAVTGSGGVASGYISPTDGSVLLSAVAPGDTLSSGVTYGVGASWQI